MGLLSGRGNVDVSEERYWTEWFGGFERKRCDEYEAREEVVPALMRQARSLNEVRMYVEACMMCR